MIKYTITQKNKARGDSTWYGRMFDTDTKVTRFVSLGTPLKRLADEWLRNHIASEVAGIGSNDAQLCKAIDDFVRQYERTPSHTAYSQVMTILKVFAVDEGIGMVSDLTPPLCIKLFSTMDGTKPSTRKMRLTIYRTFFKWCANVFGVKRDNPFSVVKVEKAEPPDRSFWTMEQLDKILNATDDKEERLCYALMAYAGLRIHEALKLRGCDIHDGKVHIVGKGGKFAAIPVSKYLKAELALFGELPSGRILAGTGTTFAYYYRLERLFATHPELDFGGKVHPHRFRHSFASNLARAGVSLNIICKAMRHSSITMTMRYAHLLPDDITDALDKA